MSNPSTFGCTAYKLRLFCKHGNPLTPHLQWHATRLYAGMLRILVIDESRGRAAFQAGVSAYVVNSVYMARIKPIVDVAIARFGSHQAVKPGWRRRPGNSRNASWLKWPRAS